MISFQRLPRLLEPGRSGCRESQALLRKLGFPDPLDVAKQSSRGSGRCELNTTRFGWAERPCASPDSRRRMGSPVAARKLATCSDVQRGSSLQFKPARPLQGFCSFVETHDEAHVVGFFREVVAELEVARGIRDFHLKIRDRKPGFVVDVFYGNRSLAGPVDVLPGACISCDLRTPLYPGEVPAVSAGECVLPQFSDQPYVQCHVDAKARPGWIVTPKRHVERLSEMDDEELYALWTVAARALREDAIPFKSMIVNHGTYRNLPHLHLKIWVSEEDHSKVRRRWPAEKQELWATLRTLAATLVKRKAR